MSRLLILLAVLQLAIGAFMVIAPGTFFAEFAAYGERNDHYIRDMATLYLALGAVLLVAARRPSWRLPVLAFAGIQYALHTVNHAVDVNESDPGWIGPANLISLAALALLIAWLWRRAELGE